MRAPLYVTGFSLLLALSGCRIEGTLGPGEIVRTAANQRGDDNRPHEQVAATRGGDSGGVAYDPECDNPADHCLDADVYLTATGDFELKRRELLVAIQQSAPDGSGEAEFMLRKNGDTRLTQYFWRTHRPDPDEIQLGRLIAYFGGNTDKGIHYGPLDRDSAHSGTWQLSRVVSVDPIQNGYVLVVDRWGAGKEKVSVSNVRFLEGDDSPTTVLKGPEDEHFLRNHYLYSSKGLPNKKRVSAWPVAPIQEPSPETQGEGHFIHTANGNIRWTSDAFRTRPATADDIQVGDHIFYFGGNTKNGVYHGPESRADAIGGGWHVSKVVDDSRLFRGIVKVVDRWGNGTEDVAVDAARVIVDGPPQAMLDAEAPELARAAD